MKIPPFRSIAVVLAVLLLALFLQDPYARALRAHAAEHRSQQNDTANEFERRAREARRKDEETKRLLEANKRQEELGDEAEEQGEKPRRRIGIWVAIAVGGIVAGLVTRQRRRS